MRLIFDRRRALKTGLAFIAICAAVVVGLRMYLRPAHIGKLSIGSPLGCESLFAIAILLIVCLRSKIEAPDYHRGNSLPTMICVVVMVVLVATLFAGNLTAPFLSDDYILIQAPRVDAARIVALFTHGGGDGSFRPLGYLWFGLLGGGAFSGISPACLFISRTAFYYSSWWLSFGATGEWRSRRRSSSAFTGLALKRSPGPRPHLIFWRHSSSSQARFCFSRPRGNGFDGPSRLCWPPLRFSRKRAPTRIRFCSFVSPMPLGE